MVRLRLLCLWVSVFAAFSGTGPALALEPEDVRLRMEFTKDRIFTGEHVLCNFVIYSRRGAIELEVAKFPEFRGYWSENLSLRQGPMPLMEDFQQPGWYKTIVGSYLLTSMVGHDTPSIFPMKVVVRDAGRFPHPDEAEHILLSSGSGPELVPLPPLTDPSIPRKAFRGAVGRFYLRSDRTSLPFRKSEPVLVRYFLQGEGNFREINDLRLELPDGVELLSLRTHAQGASQYYTKTFEYTLSVNAEENVELPGVTFAYFDPRLETYQSMTTPAITLVHRPAPAGGDTAGQSLGDESPLRQWSSRPAVVSLPALKIFHALCAGLLLLLGLARAVPFLRARWRRPERRLRREQLEQAARCLEAGEVEGFLRGADAVAFRYASEGFPRPPRTRREAVEKAPHLPETARTRLRAVFEAHDRYLYSREKTPPADAGGLLRNLRDLLRRGA